MKNPEFCGLPVVALLLSALILGSCATSSNQSALEDLPFSFENTELFGEPPPTITESQIHQLSPLQEQAFLAYFNNPSRRDIPAHQRVSDYLQLKAEYFDYSNSTYTAEQALFLGRGNCLSLAILTTAFANLVEVETRYEYVDSAPIFQLENSVVVKATHVRAVLVPKANPGQPERGSILSDFTHGGAGLAEGTADITVDFFTGDFAGGSQPGSEIYIDSFAGYFTAASQVGIQDVSDSSYLAMYYLNMAAESIVQQDYEKAYWLTYEALQHDPRSSVAYNNMAVIHRRLGDTTKSELIYQYAIRHLDNKLSLLKNYRLLLAAQGRIEEAEQIDKQIAALGDVSPINWYFAGKERQDSGDFIQAVALYQKAIELAPYLHEAQLGIAQSYYELGQLREAETHLKLAITYADGDSTQSLYMAKLHSLNREIYN